ARKVYLYFFLFLATMTVLSSAVYIVYRVLGMVLGEEPPTIAELGNAIAFSLIASGVWLYHGKTLRGDSRFARQEQASLLEALRVVVMDVGEGLFGKALVASLKSEIPDISLSPIVLTPTEAEVDGVKVEQKSLTLQLAEADLIIGPWAIAVAGGADGAVGAKIAQAVVSSPARKLLVPSWAGGWDWAGVDRWGPDAIVEQTVRAVKQVLAGEEVKAHHPMSVGSIIGIVIGVLFLLILLAIPLINYFV
ncbi:MAG: DUF3842 family protein, partial [Chloroflexota bacterium]